MNNFKNFLLQEMAKAKANEGYDDIDKENFVFFYLSYMYNYDLEEHDKAQEYILRATSFEMYNYVLEIILPTIKNN